MPPITKVIKCSRYIFAFGTVPNQELAQLLPYMNQNFDDTYFMLGADHDWPHMFEATEPIISALGGRVVGKEFTAGQETDFSALIDRIAATKAKALLFHYATMDLFPAKTKGPDLVTIKALGAIASEPGCKQVSDE